VLEGALWPPRPPGRGLVAPETPCCRAHPPRAHAHSAEPATPNSRYVNHSQLARRGRGGITTRVRAARVIAARLRVEMPPRPPRDPVTSLDRHHDPFGILIGMSQLGVGSAGADVLVGYPGP
jgi:hypothetical protein